LTSYRATRSTTSRTASNTLLYITALGGSRDTTTYTAFNSASCSVSKQSATSNLSTNGFSNRSTNKRINGKGNDKRYCWHHKSNSKV
jgi:hypothetical protein